VGASTSHNPMGLHGRLQGYLYLKINVTTQLVRNVTSKATVTNIAMVRIFEVTSNRCNVVRFCRLAYVVNDNMVIT
jgi:hypothetical protein